MATNSGFNVGPLQGNTPLSNPLPIRHRHHRESTPESSQVSCYATRAGDLGRVRSSRNHLSYAVAITAAQGAAAAYVTGPSRGAQEGGRASKEIQEVVSDIKNGQTVTRAARYMQNFARQKGPATNHVGDATDEATTALSTEEELTSGARAMSTLGNGIRVLGGVGSMLGIPASLAATVLGGMELHQGMKDHSSHEEVSGGLQIGAGAAGTTASVAGTMAFFGTAAAAPVAVVAGGGAAVISGVRDIYDAKDNYHRGVGIAKTGAGTAMIVGAAMCASGVGAPLGAALVLGGAIAVAGSYLANTETGEKIIKGAAHGVAEAAEGVAHGVVEGATAVEHAASKAWSLATSWL